MIVGVYGCLIATHLGTSHADIRYLDVLSIGGFGFVAMILLIVMIMLRSTKPEIAQEFEMSAERL